MSFNDRAMPCQISSSYLTQPSLVTINSPFTTAILSLLFLFLLDYTATLQYQCMFADRIWWPLQPLAMKSTFAPYVWYVPPVADSNPPGALLRKPTVTFTLVRACGSSETPKSLAIDDGYIFDLAFSISSKGFLKVKTRRVGLRHISSGSHFW